MAETPQDDAPPAARTWRCMCHGCPVTAGIDAGNGETICRFHHGAPASQWPAITDRLREREWMVKAADYCAAGDVKAGWFDRATAAANRAGRPDLAPTHNRKTAAGVTRDDARHPMLYAQALNGVLYAEVITERVQQRMPQAIRAAMGAMRIGAIVGDMETESQREARLEREAMQAEAVEV